MWQGDPIPFMYLTIVEAMPNIVRQKKKVNDVEEVKVGLKWILRCFELASKMIIFWGCEKKVLIG